MAGGTHKGPANAVIRQVSEAEAEAAFAGSPEEAAVQYPGANRVGGPGGRGSTAGIRMGVTDSEGRPVGPAGGLDIRAAENLARRNRRAPAAPAPAPAGRQVPPPKPAAQPPSLAVPLEPWEEAAFVYKPETTLPETAWKDQPPADAGDALERARLRALTALQALPAGIELFVGGQGLGPEGVEFVMGLGLLVGQGIAVYRGGSHYRLKGA